MKDLFHGYFKPTQAEFKKLWNESIFAFDANILLNLYRYSEATRNELLKVMSLLNDRIWLPHQATEEYFRNRITTTGGQAKEYDKISASLNELLSNLGNKKRHPFLSDKLYKELEGLVAKIKSEFDISKNGLNERIYNDEIQDKISELFNKKVGSKLEQKKLDEIYREGKIRYEAEVPPGFKDGSKDNSGNLYRKFGDLIIWNELILKAKEENKSLIFITDDKKEDWWLEYSGKTISPLPALIQEFKEQSSQPFYMYTADRFMQAATEYSSERVEQDVIFELKEFRQQEESERNVFSDIFHKRLEELFNISSKPAHRIASEEEILSHLVSYSNLRREEVDGFIGLKHFVTSYLADKGIEINHAYSVLNSLNEKELISIYSRQLGSHFVKAININME